MSNTFIHPTSFVESGAELDEGVYVGPFCTVGAKTKIKKGTRLISHVVTDGDLEIGEDNIFYPFCAIGMPPQDTGYQNEPTRVEIGARNIFREGNTVHRGTPKDRALTTIGNDNYLMAYSHVAHDCIVGDKVIMANQTALAGHVRIGNFCNIGGCSAITQWVRMGDYSFLGAGTILRRDLPPYMCAKEFSQVSGPNLVGLKRQGLKEEDVRVTMEIYKTLYLGHQTTEKALLEIEERYGQNKWAQFFIEFVRSSKIGIQR